jgi:hypothetical protein
MAAKNAPAAKPAELPADWHKNLTPKFGVTVLSTAGRSSVPSVFLDAATKSLAASATDLSTAWVAFENVPKLYSQQLTNEWTKAARSLKCGIAKHVTEHANGTVTVAYRCQPKRDKKPNAPKPAEATATA